jgi:signal transduction histidine kinase
VRLLARSAEDRTLVVVGQSLDDRDEALGDLLGDLLLIGPAALLLASLLGYGVATAALRPVEAMRAEAAVVSAAEPGRRLPLPRSRDEVSRLGATLNEMLGRLERALERERSFVADASHELRTPLALLKTELELALRTPRTEAELEQALRSAAGETDRLAQLVEDLLVLARTDEGRLPLRRSPVPARDVLAAVAERFRRRAEAAGRTIEVEAPESLVVAADAVRLEQALGNLVENALRHGRGSIRLAASEGGGGIELHVLDEGPGFPPAFLERAFERFARADEARTKGGAGLGLAIARVIAEAHGGSAHASGRAGGGADVWLALPAGARA